MSCEQIIEYIQRDLDEDLSLEEAAKLEEHLRICGDCRKVNDRLKKLNQQLLVLPEIDPPISIVDQLILPQLEGNNQVQPGFFTRFRKPLTFAGCAVIFFATLLGMKDHFTKITKDNRQVALAPKLDTGEASQPLKTAEKPLVAAQDQANPSSEIEHEVQKPTSQSAVSGNGSSNGKKPAPKVQSKPSSEKAVAIAEQPKITASVEKPMAADSAKAPMQVSPNTAVENKPALAAPKTTVLAAPKTLMAGNTPSANPVFFPSPYSSLTAKVEGNALIVADETGKPIYQSHKWDGNPTVSVEWIDENHLDYELKPETTAKFQTFKAMTVETSEKWSVDLKLGQEQKE
jgi:hypothetical protein